jgi:hypothetical protein
MGKVSKNEIEVFFKSLYSDMNILNKKSVFQNIATYLFTMVLI